MRRACTFGGCDAAPPVRRASAACRRAPAQAAPTAAAGAAWRRIAFGAPPAGSARSARANAPGATEAPAATTDADDLGGRVFLKQQRAPGGSRQPSCPSVTVNIRPVFFRASAHGAPTGHTFATRFAEANRIWRQCGVAFTASAPRIVTDPAAVTAGDTDADFTRIRNVHGTAGNGPEVFFLDNDLADPGGGVTGPRDAIGDAAKIMLSDRGANTRLLAHELGHAMGLFHPDGRVIPRGTIMDATASNNTINPDAVTRTLCVLIRWPASGLNVDCFPTNAPAPPAPSPVPPPPAHAPSPSSSPSPPSPASALGSPWPSPRTELGRP